jgi:hypothetical protein
MHASSPMPMQTPLNFNSSSTPIIVGGLSSMTPLYNFGNTSYHGNSVHRQSSQLRSPSYLFQGSSSNSPIYSSLRSNSP